MTTNHAEVIRKALQSHSNWGGRLVAAEGLAALDALTREAEEAKAGWDASEAKFDADIEAARADLDATIAAQAEHIKALEEALARIEGHTTPDVAPGTPAPNPRWIHGIARAALAPKEAKG